MRKQKNGLERYFERFFLKGPTLRGQHRACKPSIIPKIIHANNEENGSERCFGKIWKIKN
jgi:hypothetical protein